MAVMRFQSDGSEHKFVRCVVVPSLDVMQEAVGALRRYAELSRQKIDLPAIPETLNIDRAKWRKGPPDAPSFDEIKSRYVRRHELWCALAESGLSVNQAAKKLGRGKQFRKWANRNAAPNELTRITRREIEQLAGRKWPIMNLS